MKRILKDEGIRRQVQATVLGLSLPLLLIPLSSLTKTILALLVTALVTGNRPYWIYIIVKTLPRDLRIIKCMIMVQCRLWLWARTNMTVCKIFFKLAEKHPYKVAFHTEDGEWTYQRLARFAARFAASLPVDVCSRGTPVGLILGTKASVRTLGSWLGLAVWGMPAALLPPVARLAALKHAILAAKANVIIFSDETAEAIAEIQDDPDLQHIVLLQYNIYNKSTEVLRRAVAIDPEDERLSPAPNMEEIKKGNIMDNLIYIYTSGTTGLPKAAIISNSRYILISSIANCTAFHPDDVLYCALPLHHTAGGVLGAGQAICNGITVALRCKFSASNFWTDCIKYKCTVAQYIGEVCRFLLIAQEKSKSPVPDHNLRMMLGNGLRGSIWKSFQSAFKIPQIIEFYGATEGNANMINIDSMEGAVGFLPRLFSFVSPIFLIKCDGTTGEPIRDARGLCIPCDVCQPGLLVGNVNRKKPLYSYTGYVDKAANEKKMIRDVLEKGDCYFNSGDVMVMDDLGFFYFKDRTGDTFRWRGENVSTEEVESILTSVIGLSELVVYGVEIPHIEGKAGMAAVVDTDNKLDIPSLAQSFSKALPPYSKPMFIRVLSAMPLTTTFKMIKTDFKKEGFNVSLVKDKIYFLDPNTSNYILLTQSIYDDICEGRIRL